MWLVFFVCFRKKSASEELTSLLKEKEEQIAGLMEEGELPLSSLIFTSYPISGEKLSKKELQNSNVIKKLKEKNKQNDQLLTAQRYRQAESRHTVDQEPSSVIVDSR